LIICWSSYTETQDAGSNQQENSEDYMWLDELPPNPVRSSTNRNEQVWADEVQEVIVYNSLRQNFSSKVKTFPGSCATRRFITVFNKDPLYVRITSQINPVHDLTFYVLKIHFKIILPSTPTSWDRSLFFRFPHQNPACVSLLRHRHHMFNSFQVRDLIIYSTKVKKLHKYWEL
jgi:hypothetical protein